MVQGYSYAITERRVPELIPVLLVEHSDSGKKKFRFDSILAIESIFSIRFGNLINLPLVHWYLNSKLGVIFIVFIA